MQIDISRLDRPEVVVTLFNNALSFDPVKGSEEALMVRNHLITLREHQPTLNKRPQTLKEAGDKL